MSKSEMVLCSSDKNHSYLPLMLTSYLYSFLNELSLYLWTFFLHRLIIYAPPNTCFLSNLGLVIYVLVLFYIFIGITERLFRY